MKLINRLFNTDNINGLEAKLLQFFISVELVWALFNGIMSIVLKLPKLTTITYSNLLFGIIFIFYFGYKLHLERFLSEVYFVLVIFTIPVVWYFVGGARTSANILFVLEVVIFTMCLKGKKQIIYLVLALITVPATQAITGRLEHPVLEMTPMQYSKCGSVLGLSTSIMIAVLLIKQKVEYEKEKNAVIEKDKELVRSNSLQKNFLANMSHEIRSPLGIVMGFNNLIKDSKDLDQIHEYSDNITNAGTTLLTVINDILDYSKIESGKLDIIEEDYSFTGLIKDLSTEIDLKCKEKGLQFITNVDSSIPSRLYGDSIRIRQCLINVLSNAVKYTEQGTISFHVTGKEVEPQIYEIRFEIADTGKGISEEALPNIFTAFQRLDEGMNRGIEGTGLGLAITKNLMDEMHGTIDVTSQIGEGTTFVITIRQKQGKEDEKKIEEIKEDLSGIKVLVVDDAAMNLTLMKRLLNKKNMEVVTIDNGKDCLIDTMDHKYDLILLDHMMPEMDGIEVFEKLKEQNGANKDTPVVMLTANAMTGASQEYLSEGFDGYLSKPVVPNDLYKMIGELVTR